MVCVVGIVVGGGVVLWVEGGGGDRNGFRKYWITLDNG